MIKYKYYQLKKKGICTNCCKRKAIENRVKCQQCLDQDKMYQSKKYQLKGKTVFRLNKKINYIFKYKGAKEEKAKFYLKTNKILYKNLINLEENK